MVAAAERDAIAAARVLGAFLKNSSANTFPGLGDPLEIDFGAHRWLRGAREESYSDWLAWIIDRQAKAERILPLFGVESGILAGETKDRTDIGDGVDYVNQLRDNPRG